MIKNVSQALGLKKKRSFFLLPFAFSTFRTHSGTNLEERTTKERYSWEEDQLVNHHTEANNCECVDGKVPFFLLWFLFWQKYTIITWVVDGGAK